jgi:diguanylate cyclase (GGDEF)-like protein
VVAWPEDSDASRSGGEDAALRQELGSWKILIVDDEPSVHQVTRLALQDFRFAGRELLFLGAYSASEAISLLTEHPDVALILLDVVMETPDAGLKLVREVRETLGNRAVRIIMRTGQPGQAPERRVVAEYDINDYKEKTELTATKLFTTVFSALRAYRDIRALETNRRGLETIIEATANMFRSRALGEFALGVLEQLTSLLYLEPDAVYCQADGLATAASNGDMEIIAATGRFRGLIGVSTTQIEEKLVADAIAAAREGRTHVLWKDKVYAAYFRTESGYENIVCVQSLASAPLRLTRLIDLFLRNVSIAFDNIYLHRDLSQEISVRRDAERREAILARLPGELPEPVIRVSEAGKVLYANDSSGPILAQMGGGVGRRLPDPWPGRVAEMMRGGRRRDEEFVREGRTYEVSFSPVREAGYVNVFGRDVTAFREMVVRLERAAFQDPLTGLANRLDFNRHLQQSVYAAERYHSLTGLLLIDLDQFKQLNDTWGHEGGDRALQEVARRLRHFVRSADLVARLGGDEFGIVLTRLDCVDTMRRLAERIIEELSRPFEWEGRSWPLTCSIGLTTFPADARNAEDLQRCADLAMYQAKKDGAPGFRFYDIAIHRRMRHKTEMELELRLALNDGRFAVFYQPLVHLKTGQVIGAEALLRLHGRDGRMTLPGEFIHVAEETGLIDPIGEWVMRRACTDLKSWRERGLRVPRLAVNVSSRQFRNAGLAGQVSEILADAKIPASAFELEITESVLLGEEESILNILQELRDAGLTLTVDDFGTGYSSLSYLRRLPVAKLKIDRSFVSDMLASEDASAIVDAIVSLGKSLRLRVLAEGIEHRAQVDFLLSKGCAEGQGFHFFEPLTAGDFADLLARSSSG